MLPIAETSGRGLPPAALRTGASPFYKIKTADRSILLFAFEKGGCIQVKDLFLLFSGKKG